MNWYSKHSRRPWSDLRGPLLPHGNPWPVAEADIGGERVRVWTAKAISGGPANAGALVAASRDGIDIAGSDGLLRIMQLQRAGGRPISAQDFLNARPDLRNSRG